MIGVTLHVSSKIQPQPLSLGDDSALRPGSGRGPREFNQPYSSFRKQSLSLSNLSLLLFKDLHKGTDCISTLLIDPLR